MFSETIATYIFVSIVLLCKRNSAATNGRHAVMWILAIGGALVVVNEMMGEVSGGVVNPAIATSVMIWQGVTLEYDLDR